MYIGIDARMYGPHVGGGGLGRYVEQLVTQLQAIDHKNRYVLFLKKENFDTCKISNPNFEKRLADIHWYTLKEQFSFGKIVDREHLDLVHFPHWNVPIKMKTPFIVTIHDLILLDEPVSATVSTKNIFIFYAKFFAYRFVLSHTMFFAQQIIAVSNTTKISILSHFPNVNPGKISVIYEGVTSFSSSSHSTIIQSPYLLYVGNAYPHKNLNRLIKSFEEIQISHPNIKLVLTGRESVFYKRLISGWSKSSPTSKIFYVKNPSDEQLATLYQNALIYVYPSRNEGFGLPPLEAMSMNVPVAVSDIPSLREILKDAVVYFPPNDTEAMTKILSKLIENESERNRMIKLGQEHLKLFSFEKMAMQTKACYELCDQKKY